jgi:hypothetical protein
MSDLTAQEQAHVRAALRFLRVRCGGVGVLAKTLRFTEATVRHVVEGRAVSAAMAFRVARLAGVGVDELLGGQYPPPGTCPHCGHHPASSISPQDRLTD